MKQLFQNLLVTILTLSIYSCGNSQSKIPKRASTSSEAINIDNKYSTLATVSTVSFPQNVAMLLPTQYRKKSTGYPKGVKEKEWYEFYKDEKSGKCMIAKAEMKITYERDECVGEDVMIIQSKHENSILFFTPFEGLANNLNTILEDISIFPFINTNFRLNGKNYQLTPYGNVYNEAGESLSPKKINSIPRDELEYTEIKSYELAILMPDGRSLTITEIENIRSVIPKVIWAGDLNNDGLPDMILDLSNFYENQHLILYLSDQNDLKYPIKKITELEVANDC